MRVMIDAGLVQGEPRLRIVDADSGVVRLHWRYRSEQEQTTAAEANSACRDHTCVAHANMHTLFRELFLLSCVNAMSMPDRAAAGDQCLHCDKCVSAGDKDLASWREEAGTLSLIEPLHFDKEK